MIMHAPKSDSVSDDMADASLRRARPDDILALATSSDPWSPAVMAGIALAARWDANLTSCYIEPALRKHGSVDSEPTVLGLLLQPRGEDGGERAAFASMARRHGVREALWSVAHNGVASTLGQLGAWHDLAVLERDVVERAHLFDILGEALLCSRIPCLVLPPHWDREIVIDLVAVGWDGSIEAARAIHAALPFLQAARKVFLLEGERYGLEEDADIPAQFDPVSYLLRHHVVVDRHPVHTPPHLAGEMLLKEARHLQADLLVMGAYGHSRLRERVLGGATRHVLEHADIPVLMQH